MRNLVAPRAANVEASVTIQISGRAAELKRQGVDIVSLSVGEPDFDTPQHVKDACKKALDENFTHYTQSPGIPELREAIAAKSVKENGIECQAKHVLVTPTKMALFASALAFLEPGDEVLITDPSFVSYAPIITFAGGKPVWVPLRDEDPMTIRAADVAERITNKTKMVWLCSPGNPTGHVDDPAEVRGIVELAQDHGLLILSDEIYEKMQYDGKPFSPASLAFDRTLTVNGLSKSHAMTGWRAGWLVADSPLFEPVARIQSQSITHIPSFIQKAMVAAVTGPQEPVAHMAKEFIARRKLVMDLVARSEHLEAATPRGAFYIWPKYDVPFESLDVAKHLLEKHRVAVVPGSAFGPSGSHRLRLSYGAPAKTLEEGFRRMEAGFDELKKMGVAARGAKA
jgi:aspartate aminotransferase